MLLCIFTRFQDSVEMISRCKIKLEILLSKFNCASWNIYTTHVALLKSILTVFIVLKLYNRIEVCNIPELSLTKLDLIIVK